MEEINHNVYSDPTLDAMNEKIEDKQKLEKPRHYLGASQIGEECWRKLFYSFRKAAHRTFSAKGIKSIQDGYDQEDKTIERLRALPFLELINEEENGEQIGFKKIHDHFRGHCDGVIRGLRQAPLTWHVFEHKSVNETKFKKLQKLIEEVGEKKALEQWDEIYYAQAQIYMHCFNLKRHYTVVSTPGGRDHVSCRTNYKQKAAEILLNKAKTIIFDNWILPAGISTKREFFKCKWCECSPLCHDKEIPLVNCKTCRYREPVKDGQNMCQKNKKEIEDHLLDIGCNSHVFNPALIPAKLIEHQEDGCLYIIEESGIKFSNTCLEGLPELKGDIDYIYTSQDLFEKIKSVENIKKNTIDFQKKVDGEIIKEKKEWGSHIDPRLKGI